MLNINSVKSAVRADIALSPLMTEALQKWSLMYNNNSPWLNSEIKSLNLAAAISADIARSTTIEMDVELTGGNRAKYLSIQLEKVLDKIRTYTEYACAKGGLVFKPYLSGDNIFIDIVQADMFYPIAFDSSGNMTACVFADQKQIGYEYYTKLEAHSFSSRSHKVINTAWKSSTKDTLGNQVPLSSVPDWAELEPEVTITNVDRPLFAYFKMPFANNIDSSSPLGVSAYSRAVDLIEQADRLWSNFIWEFESGKRALYTDILAFGKDEKGKPVIPDKRFYKLLDLQSRVDGKGLFEDWSPTIRDVNLLNGIDAILRRIEFNCGLSYGVLSNPDTVALTATEIKSAKQRYYVTVSDIQKALKNALDDLLYAMDIWATLNKAPSGTYDLSVTFDDSIITDKDSQFMQDMQAVGLNAMSLVEFRMRTYGETEEEAKKMLAMVSVPASPESLFSDSETA